MLLTRLVLPSIPTYLYSVLRKMAAFFRLVGKDLCVEEELALRKGFTPRPAPSVPFNDWLALNAWCQPTEVHESVAVDHV
jgi:hypothetical protein